MPKMSIHAHMPITYIYVPLTRYRVCIYMSNFASYRRQNGQEGFVPANYVKEVEPLVTTKTVRRKEMVSVPVKVRESCVCYLGHVISLYPGAYCVCHSIGKLYTIIRNIDSCLCSCVHCAL